MHVAFGPGLAGRIIILPAPALAPVRAGLFSGVTPPLLIDTRPLFLAWAGDACLTAAPPNPRLIGAPCGSIIKTFLRMQQCLLGLWGW